MRFSFTTRLIIALMSAEILGVFEVTMLLAAMKHLIVEFGSPVAVGWLFTSFGLSSAMCAALGSRIGDLYGRKRVLMMAIALGGIGSFIASMSPDISGVMLGRVMQGSSGAILPLCIGIVRENVDKDKAPLAIGMLTATVTISAGFALIIGGAILDLLNWRGIFFVGASVSCLALALILMWVPASRQSHKSENVNFVGGLLFAPGLAALLIAITLSRNLGWQDVRIITLCCGGLVLLAAWIRSELASETPLINVRLLTNRQVALANLIFAVLAFSVMQKGYLISLLLQQPLWTEIGLGQSATFAGIIVLPAALMAFLGGPGAGLGVMKFGAKKTLIFGAICLLAGWGGVMLQHHTWQVIMIWLTLAGLGLSIVYSVVPIIIVANVPPERTSEAIGIPTVIRSTFMGLGAQAIALLLATSKITGPDQAVSYPDASAFHAAFLYMLIGCCAIFLIAVLVPSQKNSQ